MVERAGRLDPNPCVERIASHEHNKYFKTNSGVGLVHDRELVHILDENSGLDDIIERCAGLCKHAGEVLDHLLGLLLYTSLNNVSSCRVDWYLSADECQPVGNAEWRVWAARL